VIARKTAKSILRRTIPTLGLDVVVHLLDNGQRVIKADSVRRLVPLMEADAAAGGTPANVADLMQWMEGAGNA